jgi:hypothetical protein
MTRIAEEERKSLPAPPRRRFTVTVTGQLPNGICEGLLTYETTVVKWSAMLPGYERCEDAYTRRSDAPVHNIWVNADKERELAAALLIRHFQELHDQQWKEAERQRKREEAAHRPENNYGMRL